MQIFTDGRLFLLDFGAGHFSGAGRLTPLHLLPGTPEYRSPQLWESLRNAEPGATAPLLAQPCDDVFALGVTAYRLVTDTYPPLPLPDMKQGQCWLPGGGGVPPPRQLNPRVDAQLNALILRMLSLRPEERGTAGELTEAMQRGVTHAGPSADAPMFEWETLRSSQWTEQERADAEHLGHRPRRRDRKRAREAEQRDCAPAQARQLKNRRWLPWLAAALALGLWPEQTGSVRTEEKITRAAPDEAKRKAEAVSLGEVALSSSDTAAKTSSSQTIALEVPKEPMPGQIRPNAKGRCRQEQVPINGGCWAKVVLDVDLCHGNLFVYRDGCYAPVFEPVRKPTSAPRQHEP
jgi:hypothetical protein